MSTFSKVAWFNGYVVATRCNNGWRAMGDLPHRFFSDPTLIHIFPTRQLAEEAKADYEAKSECDKKYTHYKDLEVCRINKVETTEINLTSDEEESK